MWNRRILFTQIFIILLIKVSRIQSNCSWDSNSVQNCALTCDSGFLSLIPLATILTNLNKTWTERTVCHDDGIDLKLENIRYPENTVAAKFFEPAVKVKVKTLTIKLRYITLDKPEKIEPDAFSSPGFKFMRKLVISNAMFEPIKKGTFNGLEHLEVLNIGGLQLGVIETGVLDVLNGTLKEFSLEESLSLGLNKEILIDGFTGAGVLNKLETVKFRYNLKTSITRATFTGLTNVRTLDLSDCQIETIAVGSFDSLHFLEILQLENNRLTTISDEFFSNILIRNKTQIFLQGNRFLCDCALMPFKMLLIEYSNFVGQPKCSKPDKFSGYKIIEMKFDDETCVSPTTVASPTSSPPLQCQLSNQPETVFIDPPSHTMHVYQTEGDDVILRIDALSENAILIWFPTDDDTSNSSVHTNRLTDSDSTFHIVNLDSNVAYTLCLMDKMEVMISPLDCVSFVKRSGMIAQWLNHNAKGRFIGIAFVACSVGILVGAAIGGLTHKMWTMNRREPFIRSYQSSRCSSMSRSRTSMMTRRTTNTTIQYFINGNYDAAPPLPARPASMYLMDEPVYATIRDIRSILASSQTSDNLQASNEMELKTI